MRVLIVLLTVLVGLGLATPSAHAQPTCSEGTLVGDQCELVGQPPRQRGDVCPVSDTVFEAEGGCYSLVAPLAGGVCPVGTFRDGSLCRLWVGLVSLGFGCPDAGYQVVGERCVRYVDPTCGPNGCNGKITLRYTVDCLRDGVSRVTLGQPTLVNGAQVSFITVNGSATVGVELQAGTPVDVVVTPERLSDEVVVSGPTVAPPCGIAAPTAAPTPVPTSPPPPATPAPTSPPAPTSAPGTPVPATPAPSTSPTRAQARITDYTVGECDGTVFDLTVEAEIDPAQADDELTWSVDDFEDTIEARPGTVTLAATGDGETHVITATPRSAAEPAVLVLDFPDCSPAPTEPTAVAATAPAPTPAPPTSATPPAATAPAVTLATNDLPVLPLAIVGGATVVGAVAAYGFFRRP